MLVGAFGQFVLSGWGFSLLRMSDHQENFVSLDTAVVSDWSQGVTVERS